MERRSNNVFGSGDGDDPYLIRSVFRYTFDELLLLIYGPNAESHRPQLRIFSSYIHGLD